MTASPRTQLISVDTGKLARHAVTLHYRQRDMVRLIVTPQDGDRMLLTVDAIAGHTCDEDELWFRYRVHADRLLEEMVTLEAMPWKASRVEGGGVLLETSEGLLSVLKECFRWTPFSYYGIVRAKEVEDRIVEVEKELDLCMVQLQVTGANKQLNAEYKALRTAPRAPGEKLPSYKNWMTARLEDLVLQRFASGLTA